MRNKDIFHLLTLVRDPIARLSPKVDGSGYFLHELSQFQKAVETLDSAHLFPELTRELKSSWIFNTYDEDTKYVVKDTWAKISVAYWQLLARVESMIEATSIFVPNLENSLEIRLPKLRDFNDLAHLSNELNQAIGIPVSEEGIGGNLEIASVDRGSIWLYVVLGTSTAISLIGALLFTAASVYKKWQEALANRAYVKNLNMQNDVYDQLVAGQKLMIDQYVAEEIKQIDSEFFQSRDPERVARLKHSIETFAKLLERGLQVEPSMLMPENVKARFPDLASLNFQPSETKQLGQNTN